VNRSTLVERLEGLVRAGLLVRESVSESSDRAIYVPTDSAVAYVPVLLSMLEWGRRWQVEAAEGQLLRVVHEHCGASLATAV